jgi:DNA-binding NarL/FixJ family response regulator
MRGRRSSGHQAGMVTQRASRRWVVPVFSQTLNRYGGSEVGQYADTGRDRYRDHGCDQRVARVAAGIPTMPVARSPRPHAARRVQRTRAARRPRPATRSPRVTDLLPRVRRVAELASEGHSEAEIAHRMVFGLDTVRSLAREAHDVLGTDPRAGLRRVLSR